MAIACVAPGATAGVMLNVSGLADRPVTAGDGRVTVHVTEAAVPLVRVTTTFGVVPDPATTVEVVGLQATLKLNAAATVRAKMAGGARMPRVQLTLSAEALAGEAVVVVMAIACVATGATAGVMLNVNGEAARPVATGTVTVQDTAVVVPLVKVATTFGVVPEPATTLALVGFQATV